MCFLFSFRNLPAHASWHQHTTTFWKLGFWHRSIEVTEFCDNILTIRFRLQFASLLSTRFLGLNHATIPCDESSCPEQTPIFWLEKSNPMRNGLSYGLRLTLHTSTGNLCADGEVAVSGSQHYRGCSGAASLHCRKIFRQWDSVDQEQIWRLVAGLGFGGGLERDIRLGALSATFKPVTAIGTRLLNAQQSNVCGRVVGSNVVLG